MSDAERVRALVAQAAAVGLMDGEAEGRGGWQMQVGDPLRVLLQAVDATVLPRRLTLALQPHDHAAPPRPHHSGDLRLVAAERRLRVLGGSVPSGLAAGSAALFDTPLAFDDAARMAEVAGVLAAWADAARGRAVLVREDRLEDDRASDTGAAFGPGIAATALADLMEVEIWPDRSLAARLEAWMPEAWQSAVAGIGYGALAGEEMAFGDAAAGAILADRIRQLAPDGVEQSLASALAVRPAAGSLLGLVALSDGHGQALVIAGSEEAGLVALVPTDKMPALVRAWQRA